MMPSILLIYLGVTIATVILNGMLTKEMIINRDKRGDWGDYRELLVFLKLAGITTTCLAIRELFVILKSIELIG